MLRRYVRPSPLRPRLAHPAPFPIGGAQALLDSDFQESYEQSSGSPL